MTDRTLRLDAWLWRARFFTSRSRASRLCRDGKIRIDRAVVTRASRPVRPGAVLTFPYARTIRVVRVLALGSRRGPPAEARGLYEEVGEAGNGRC